MSKIYRLSGIGNLVSADITSMTDGELDRYQSARQLAALAETANPEVQRSLLADANALLSGQGGSGVVRQYLADTAQSTAPAYNYPNISGVGNIVDKVKNALKGLVNDLVKKLLPAIGPVFLYAFMPTTLKGRAGMKQAKMFKAIKAICKVTGLKESTAMAALKEGIIKKLGKTPEALIAEMAKKKVSGIGVIPPQVIQLIVTTILPLYIKVVKTILQTVGKKGEMVELKPEDMPSEEDFAELTEAVLTSTTTTKGGSNINNDPTPQSGGGSTDDDDEPDQNGDDKKTPIGLIAVGLGLAYFIFK